jgi:hypothetical protein
MSDSENYFSDSDNEQVNFEENTNTPESDGYESSEYEMDEESRRIVFEHARLTADKESTFFQDNEVPKKNSKKRKKKKKQKENGTSLQDFLDELKEKEEEGKPKKWSSKRLNDKKDKLGLSKQKVVRRRFNPRMPPPTHLTFKKKEVKVKVEFSAESFPSLSVDVSSNKSNNVTV